MRITSITLILLILAGCQPAPEEYFARALSAVTGLDFSTGDLIRVGERVWNLERLYNLRDGFSAADDIH